MHHPRLRRLPAVALAAGLGLALTGCAAANGPDALPVPDSAGATTADFGHVHALDFDPVSGALYAATHTGVWLLPAAGLPEGFPTVTSGGAGAPGTAVQIAGRSQDTMAFTVAEPGLLLGSGHPDPVEQPELDPPNLGLIASTDGAATWQTRSLRGTTDFHDLDAVVLQDGRLRVVGYDSTAGLVRTSDDGGVTWSTGAALGLRDLAIDPAAPTRVLATTADGLLASDDLGVTFAPVAGAPELVLVSSRGGGGFVGVDVDGVIWVADGDEWMPRGRTSGVPEAITVVDGPGGAEWLLVADARGIVVGTVDGEPPTMLVPAG